MPNPNSNNAFYFSHDADMRNDIKIKALRRQHGHLGYSLWCFILETLTDSENFEVEYTEINKELLASDYDVTTEQLDNVVSYCRKIGLLQIENNRLFSATHKRRFESLIEAREKRRMAGKLGMEKRWGAKQEDSNVIANDNNVITTDNNTITQNNKEDKSKSKSKSKEKNKENIKYRKEESKNKEKDMVLYPYQDIATLWNSICTLLPKVKQLTEGRKNKIKARIIESGAKTKEQAIEWATNLFTEIQSSDFLTGCNKNDWTASFDWVFENSKNWLKIAEGNYKNKENNSKAISDTNTRLGVGEYYSKDGKRTYGSGIANIPTSAPPRPSERHLWSAETETWVML